MLSNVMLQASSLGWWTRSCRFHYRHYHRTTRWHRRVFAIMAELGIVQFQTYCQFAFLPMSSCLASSGIATWHTISLMYLHVYMNMKYCASKCLHMLKTSVEFGGAAGFRIAKRPCLQRQQATRRSSVVLTSTSWAALVRFFSPSTRTYTRHRASIFHYTLAGLFMTFYPQDVSSCHLNTWASPNCKTLASTHADTLIHTWIKPSNIFW